MFRRTTVIRFTWMVALSFGVLVLMASKKKEGMKRREPDIRIEECPPFAPNAGFSENIFFVETADHMSGCLTPRAVCSIESTARANPHMNIRVYIDTKVRAKDKQMPITRRGTIPSCTVTDTLNNLPNVHIIKMDLRFLLKESKEGHQLENELFMEDATQWTELHLKNSIKYVLLSTFGGIYLDMKVVTYRPLHCLRNFVLERFRSLGTEIMAFDQKHPFLKYLMRLISATYEPDSQESTGSPNLREAFNVFCNVSSAVLSLKPYKCHKDTEIEVKDWVPFSPISRLHTLKYFGHYPDSEERILEDFRRKSYLAYIDGVSWGIPVPPTSSYGVLARQYCPTAWNAVRHAEPPLDF